METNSAPSEQEDLSDGEIRRLREAEFAELGGAAYLDAASVGPLPRRSREAMESYGRSRSEPHSMGEADYVGPLNRCRSAIARLIGARPADIALVGNTSAGINLAAAGLPIPPGSCIIASAGEFPANVYPWMAQRNRGVRFELVPLTSDGYPDEDRLCERIVSGDVSVLAISSVQFSTGYRADLDRLARHCREYGVFLVVDAIQSIGHLPLDVDRLPVDVVACGGQKWLCGPFGSGFAYIRPDLLERLEPRSVGWAAFQASQDLHDLTAYGWDLLPDARRYEVGSPGLQDFLGLAHSVELLLEIGIERIQRHVTRLGALILDWATDHDGYRLATDARPEKRSGIVGLRTRDAAVARTRLRTADVHCAVREGVLRFSPHLYSTEDEVRRAVRLLETGGAA